MDDREAARRRARRLRRAVGRTAFGLAGGSILAFLVVPVIAVIPMSFSSSMVFELIPTAYAVEGQLLEETECSLSFEGGPGMYESGPFGEASGGPVPVAVETFHALKQRQTGEGMAANAEHPSRVNLLNWDGRGVPAGMFPGGGQR